MTERKEHVHERRCSVCRAPLRLHADKYEAEDWDATQACTSALRLLVTEHEATIARLRAELEKAAGMLARMAASKDESVGPKT